VGAAIEAVLAQNRAGLERALGSGEPTWDAVAGTLFDCEDRLHRAWGPVRHLHGVRDEPELRDAFNAALPLVTAYSTELSQNPQVYAALNALASDGSLGAPEQRWIERERVSFRLGGAELPAAEQARLAEIRLELSKLSSKFNENVLDATNEYEMVISETAELEGLPETARTAAAEAAGRPGAWRFTLQLPSYQAFMTHAASRERRRELYRAYFTRATSGDLDNGPLMDRLLALRQEAAGLLGYSNWAERTLTLRMARSPEEVEGFLLDLARRTRPLAERELETLIAFSRDSGGPAQPEAWDLAYWSERLREHECGFSDEEVRAYFPEPAVLEGLFGTAQRLYGVRFEPRDDVETWNPDVRYLDVLDEDGSIRGGLYLDLWAREGKRGGAWMDEAVLRRRIGAEGQELEHPVAYLVCNSGRPSGGTPALLTHREVQTLFHEFGHSLHHVLTRVDVAGVAGLRGVDWDAVEFPSQFHENWAWQPESVRLFARHHASGEPMPEALLERVLGSRRFQAGLQMLRQLEFALFDLRLHTRFEAGGRESVQDCLEQVRRELAVVFPPEWSRFQNGFGHIFGGGYAAGYYSYKWAEVLAADAFSRFEERGIFDAESGRDFLRCVLERGGSAPPGELFERFRGRPPRIDALLRQSGIEA
jgi:oligopeptidase A